MSGEMEVLEEASRSKPHDHQPSWLMVEYAQTRLMSADHSSGGHKHGDSGWRNTVMASPEAEERNRRAKKYDSCATMVQSGAGR